MHNNIICILILYLDFISPAEQWKLLGQEKDGSLLLGWIEATSKENDHCYSVVGCYDRLRDTLQVRFY